MRPTSVVIAAALLIGGTRPAHGQHLSLAPTIGIYIPTEDYLGAGASGATGKLEAGVSFGGRLGLWFGNRIGLEASGNYVPTTFALTSASSQVTKQDAKLFNGAGQLVIFLLPRTSLVTAFVDGGVGVVSHGGVAFTSQAKTTNVSGVVGAGIGLNLGGFQLTAGADLYAYKADYAVGTQVSSSLTQRDLQVRFGFGFPFGGAAGR